MTVANRIATMLIQDTDTNRLKARQILLEGAAAGSGFKFKLVSCPVHSMKFSASHRAYD